MISDGYRCRQRLARVGFGGLAARPCWPVAVRRLRGALRSGGALRLTGRRTSQPGCSAWPARSPVVVGTVHDAAHRPRTGPDFSYPGRPMHVLAGHDDQPAGFAAMEIVIPAGFPGPFRTRTTSSTRPSTCWLAALHVFGDGQAGEAGRNSCAGSTPGTPVGCCPDAGLPVPCRGLEYRPSSLAWLPEPTGHAT